MKPGKQFEKDFQQSCNKAMYYIRLNDPGQSFNKDCTGCPKQKTRFSPQNICDAIAYSYPNQYLFELKSVAGLSIPFKNIVKKEKDMRLKKMVAASEKKGVLSFIIINFRKVNSTFALQAPIIYEYINRFGVFNLGDKVRYSIPLKFCITVGLEIKSQRKRIHYGYDIKSFIDRF